MFSFLSVVHCVQQKTKSYEMHYKCNEDYEDYVRRCVNFKNSWLIKVATAYRVYPFKGGELRGRIKLGRLRQRGYRSNL